MTRGISRRTFVKSVGLTAGAALAGCTSSDEEPKVPARPSQPATSQAQAVSPASAPSAASPASSVDPSPAAAASASGLVFPAGFLWGAATSAYQIEGAAAEDGRGPSVWDTFSQQKFRISDGSNGDVAADHYHRYAEDIALMKRLGLKSYRFSISWSRVLPTGAGQVNQKGLDFYKRLVAALLEADIRPMATLWHWDTPEALQEKGGWESRDTAKHFADYSAVVFDGLGDDVPTYLTLNEPKTVVGVGYLYGAHAPGVKDLSAATRVLHHLLLGHGLSVQAFRASGVQSEIGPALNLTPVYPVDETPEAKRGAALQDIWDNLVYLEPIYKGSYPADGLAEVLDKPALDAVLEDGDLKSISEPIDVLAINYYTPLFVGAERTVVRKHPMAEPTNWLEIYPPGLHDLLVRVDRDYGKPRMIITENGRPTTEAQSPDGSYADDKRIEYVRDHLVAAHRAIAAGVKLEGYQLWSFIDNFEWAEGYEQRWGLVHVDFETQKRTPKKSFGWYADVIAKNAVAAPS